MTKREIIDQVFGECDWGDNSTALSHLNAIIQLTAQECIRHIEDYQIPVGNSPAGELACDWTYDALESIRDDIREFMQEKV
jgi:hypothetical protein